MGDTIFAVGFGPNQQGFLKHSEATYCAGVILDSSDNPVVTGLSSIGQTYVAYDINNGENIEIPTSSFDEASLYRRAVSDTTTTVLCVGQISTNPNLLIARYTLSSSSPYIALDTSAGSFGGNGYFNFNAAYPNTANDLATYTSGQNETIVVVGQYDSLGLVALFVNDQLQMTFSGGFQLGDGIYNGVIYDATRTTHSDPIVAVGASTSNTPVITSYTLTAGAGGFTSATPPGISTGSLNSIRMGTIGSQAVYVLAGTNGAKGYVGIIEPSGTVYSSFNGSGLGGGSGYVLPTDDSSAVYKQAVLGTVGGTQCIVAVGQTTGGLGLISVFNVNGTRYTSFNTTGYVIAPTSTSAANATLYEGVAIDSTGRVVVAGYAPSGVGTESIVARYRSNGTIDASTYTVSQLINLFGTALESAPFYNSETGYLNLSGSTLVDQGGTILIDVTNFSTLFNAGLPTLTSEVVTIDLSGNSINTIPGNSTFDGDYFTNLTTIILDSNNTQTSEGVQYTGLQTIANGSFNDLVDLTLSIQNSADLTTIGSDTRTVSGILSGSASTNDFTVTGSVSGSLSFGGQYQTSPGASVSITGNTSDVIVSGSLVSSTRGSKTRSGTNTLTISNNTGGLTLGSGFVATNFATVALHNNSQLTTIPSGIPVTDSLTITNNSSLTTLPTGLVTTTAPLTTLNLSNNALTSLPNDLPAVTGSINVSGNPDITTIPSSLTAGSTIEGNVNLSNTSLNTIGAATLQDTVINGTLNMNNTQIAPGSVSLFAMDSATIPTITLQQTPLATSVPSLATTSSTAMAEVLHAPTSKAIIAPIGYVGVATHYQSLGVSTGL